MNHEDPRLSPLCSMNRVDFTSPDSTAARPLRPEPRGAAGFESSPGQSAEPVAAAKAPAVSEAKRALREQRLRAALSAPSKPPAIPALESRERLPLSFAQRRLWFFHQLEPASPLYNLPLALRLEGPLDPETLRQSLEAIVRRHEILRTRFVAEDGEPAQRIDPPSALELLVVDLADAPVGQEERLAELITTASEQPFDLAQDRLLRTTLYRRGATDHVLLLVTHHIAGDGWSWGVWLRELERLYSGIKHSAVPALPELSIQYADYAAWQHHRLDGDGLKALLAIWKRQLAGAPEAIELPTDFPRPPTLTFSGEWATRPLGRPLSEALKALSQREGVTLFMTLLAATSVLLSRYTQQTDLVIGAPIAGRTVVQTESLIGLFVNTLALRVDLEGDPEFRALLARVRRTALEAFDHQELPLEKLVEELQLPRRANRLPLVQVAFVFQNTPAQGLRLPDLRVTQVPSWTRTAKFELTWCVEEGADGLVVALEYNTDLFTADTAGRMLANFATLLDGIVADPGRRVSDLPLVAPSERRLLLKEWNQTARPFPREETIHAMVEAQVSRHPEAIAVTWGEQTLTYQELNTRANQLAHRLRALGVGPDQVVALCLERSPEMMITLLGILKAGGAYASLDPTYPAERLAYMLADSRATVLVTAGNGPTFSAESPVNGATGGNGARPVVLRLDLEAPALGREPVSNPAPGATAENLAYVSYTSGSTGRPKGVCIPHRAVNRLLLNTDYIALGASDAVLQIANCAFDASTFEIWGALLHGAKLVIVPSEVVLAPREFARELRTRRITALFVTTALFNQLSRHAPGLFQNVRTVLFGGEAVNPDCVRDVLQNGPPERLLHVYGPTETTTFATWHEVREVPRGAKTIPIGRPLANTTLYVLDGNRQPVPIGVAGELYIGGDGLARGYWNQPELTAEKFVPNPFAISTGGRADAADERTEASNLRLYRTGDRVRWRSDGVIEFLGRIDRQVKLRGFRIELEEIESVLEKHPNVEQAMVVVREGASGERRLFAYVAARGQPTPGAELRAHLRRSVPDYMIPAGFVAVENFPLNANGKVDRAALPAPETDRPEATRVFSAPKDAVERQLAGIWERVLEVRPVGVHDNFFELGGHSLAGVRLFAGIEQEFGRKLPLASLFQGPTVAQLAALLRAESGGETSGRRQAAGAGDSLVALQAGGNRPPLFFVHGAGTGNLWAYANLVPHLEPDQPVYAFESRAAKGGEELPDLETMAAHYIQEMRRVQPHGPYFIGGYCFGGNVAYEMAGQLEAAGERVGLVALLDSAPPSGPYYRIPWWSPVYAARFAANAAFWLNDFLGMPAEERRTYVVRKFRAWGRKRWRRPGAKGGVDSAGVDLDAIIDASLYTEDELRIWRVHVDAAWKHRPKRYGGRVTLFRTRGQPFLCSLDPQFGWGELAEGGVGVVKIPGAHEKIFLEPHVRVLGAKLSACLAEASARPMMEGKALAVEQIE